MNKILAVNRKNVMVRTLLFFLFPIFFFLCLSCTRTETNKENDIDITTWHGALPMAVLQTGEYPLWFLLTENGPVHIESIEETVYTSAFTPWPYALHIRFMYRKDDEIVMVVNRDGFFKVIPDNRQVHGIALYLFPGCDLWRLYTVGGLFFYDDKPAALLYQDSRFMDTDIAFPEQRTWSFNMESNNVFPIQIPILQQFPKDDGWDVNTMRLGYDGMVYYRVAKRINGFSQTRMFRTDDLSKTGEEISIETFFNSISHQPDFSKYSLPELPNGYFYTGIKYVGDSLFVSWEEQQDYSIGAAGFMVIKK